MVGEYGEKGKRQRNREKGGREAGGWRQEAASSKEEQTEREREKKERGPRPACLGGKWEIGSGQSLSLRETVSPCDRTGQHNYNTLDNVRKDPIGSLYKLNFLALGIFVFNFS